MMRVTMKHIYRLGDGLIVLSYKLAEFFLLVATISILLGVTAGPLLLSIHSGSWLWLFMYVPPIVVIAYFVGDSHE